MKKIMSITLVMVLVLSLFGCGGNESVSNAGSNTGNHVEDSAGNNQSEDEAIEENIESELDTQEAVTLKIYGPGFLVNLVKQVQ